MVNKIKISEEGRGTILTYEHVKLCGLNSAGEYIVGHITDSAGYYQNAVHLYKTHTNSNGDLYVMVRGKRVYITGTSALINKV